MSAQLSGGTLFAVRSVGNLSLRLPAYKRLRIGLASVGPSRTQIFGINLGGPKHRPDPGRSVSSLGQILAFL